MDNKVRGGFYWKDEKPYLRTTTTLNVIAKPQLTYWFGRMVYYAMVKDPTLDEKTALAAPYAVSDRAKKRGTTVHSIADMIEEGEVVPELQKFSDAYWLAKKTLKAEEIDLPSRTFFDEENKTAGTIDKYWLINGLRVLVDIKTGKDIYTEAGLQLSNYANMMRVAGHQIDQIAVLLLEVGEDDQPTGNYKWQIMREDFETYLACKKMYEWQNYEKLLKLGYLEVK